MASPSRKETRSFSSVTSLEFLLRTWRGSGDRRPALRLTENVSRTWPTGWTACSRCLCHVTLQEVRTQLLVEVLVTEMQLWGQGHEQLVELRSQHLCLTVTVAEHQVRHLACVKNYASVTHFEGCCSEHYVLTIKGNIPVKQTPISWYIKVRVHSCAILLL